MLESGIQPQLDSDNPYTKLKRSPLLGMYVQILGRDKTDSAARKAKGLYGFVTSVDEALRTARVHYQGQEATFKLANLVSL